MPNVKLFLDDALLWQKTAAAESLLPAIRNHLCATLGVTEAACHIVILPVRSLPGQTPANLELAILRKADRDRDRLAEVCGQLRALVALALDAPAAVRCAVMEPDSYIVVR